MFVVNANSFLCNCQRQQQGLKPATTNAPSTTNRPATMRNKVNK